MSMSSSISSKDRANFSRRIKEARIGDPSAQYDVALMYANGVGVVRNVTQAFVWTKKAAEKGLVAAQYLLAVAHQSGLGTKKSAQMALLWFVRAAENGSEKAQFKLSKLLSTGQPSLAFELALLGASRGLADAQHYVGVCYDTGIGVEVSHADALEWHLKAAEQGHAAAEFAVAQHFEGISGGWCDVVQATHWYLHAAQRGHPEAMLALNRLDPKLVSLELPASKMRSGKSLRDRKAQESHWQRYCEKGDANDHYHLAEMYERGVGVEQSDPRAMFWYQSAAELGHPLAQLVVGEALLQTDTEKAVFWLEKAACQGNSNAQLALSCHLMRVKGYSSSLPPDLSVGFQWLILAANQGHFRALFLASELVSGKLAFEYVALSAKGGFVDAQYAMGLRCERGIDVRQDHFEACRWFLLAAEQEHAEAQCSLAGCLANGQGIRKDIGRALFWYERAAAKKLPKAMWKLGELLAKGVAGVDPDPKYATLLCKRAATAGFAPAQATLGLLFASAKKYSRAVHWWTLAADQGDLESAYNLSNAYRVGRGVEKSNSIAFDRLMQAAIGGLAAAQARLGLAYATGEGAIQDVIEATMWFTLASQSNEPSAQANYVRAKASLSPAQWSEAQSRAQRFTASSRVTTDNISRSIP